MAKRTVIILQARMGSARLPGKVLMQLGNEPLLGHCLHRLGAIDPDVEVVVATSTHPRDDVIADFAKHQDVPVYRGSESDVLDRYYQAALRHQAQVVVRATADNPFVDVALGRLLLEGAAHDSWDYLSSHGRGTPDDPPAGCGLEAFTLDTLRTCWSEGKSPHHLEHVNEYVLENPSRFKTSYLKCPAQLLAPGLRLTVDTKEDLEFAQGMLSEIGLPAEQVDLLTIAHWWRSRNDRS